MIFLQNAALIVGFLGGIVGFLSGFFTIKRNVVELRKHKLDQKEKLKANIRIEEILDGYFPQISIKNIGSSSAKNLEIKVVRKSTGEIVEDHFQYPFPDVLNSGQEDTQSWLKLEGEESYSVRAKLVVCWDDEFSERREVIQEVRLAH